MLCAHRPTPIRHLASLVAGTALAGSAFAAHALDVRPYTPAALSAAQQAGKPVAVHFHADWCPTCKLQQRSLAELKREKQLDMSLLVVNYDREPELRRTMNVRSQSTIIVFKGTTEKARLAGESSPAALRKALQAAL